MRWLHLTDLHIGRKESEYQDNALRELTGAVERAIRNVGKIHAIVLTGDIANAGTKDQYQHFEQTLLLPLRSLPQLTDAIVLCVPGNHDLDCEQSAPAMWGSIGAERQRVFFSENSAGVAARKHRAKSFEEFADFCARANIRAPDPRQEVTTLESLEVDSECFDFLLTNTAFFSNREPDLTDSERAPSPIESLRSCLAKRTRTATYTFVLGHHPVWWLVPQDREPFWSFLDDKRALYLHGHAHKVEAKYVHSGLITLGFGAVYQGSLGSQTSYQNSFALCEYLDGLHVAIWQWDAANGRWIEAHSLPTEFRERSQVLPEGYRLSLATCQAALPLHFVASEKARRAPPYLGEVSLAEALTDAEWKSLIISTNLAEIPGLQAKDLQLTSSSPLTFIRNSGTQTHVLVCYPGTGHVLSKTMIENANSELDYQEYASYTILTFGTIAEDARTAYLKLKKKGLRVVLGSDIAQSLTLLHSNALREFVQSLDSAVAVASLFLFGNEQFVLVTSRLDSATFYVLDIHGVPQVESDSVVGMIRKTKPSLECAVYSPPIGTVATERPTVAFDRAAYLAACHKEFNSARYSALAAVGVSLPDVSLDQLYVEANVDVDQRVAANAAMTRAIDEMLQGLTMDASLRADIESQLRQQWGVAPMAQCGAARRMYQQFGNCVILGDPGSGKTCFVKHEILEYCKHSNSNQTWYSDHTPLFVPLSEASRLYVEGAKLLDIASALAMRRGLPVSPIDIRELASKGHIAVFFDGLDEVTSIDTRNALVREIDEIVTRLSPMGNRVVLTSRPAAIQLVTLPESLVTMYMRGLAEEEMRVLATRVLSLRISDSGVTSTSSTTSHEIVEQLIADCHAIPGIRRLATNPLLLTLLVMIYANSGRPSAKRHRVYQQAVQTLVSVRSRAAGHRPVSETDLRTRLGAVAFTLFQDPEGAIPLRNQVVEILMRAMAEERGVSIQRSEAEEFLHWTAESTGLLVLNNTHDKGTETPTVTFMHYSFLEYYAAVGLTARRSIREIASYAKEPRWKEIVTLIAGMLGDQGNVSELTSAILEDSVHGEAITHESLLFAFDCALEADVPPELAQRTLLEALGRVIDSHALHGDTELRSEFGRRLASLADATGSTVLEDFLLRGLASSDARKCGVFVDFVSRVASEVVLLEPLINAFDSVCARKEADVVVAVCDAVGRAEALRRPAALRLVRSALEGTTAVRYAAVRCCELVPALANDAWTELLQVVRDRTVYIARTAARAVLRAGLRTDLNNAEDRSRLSELLPVLQKRRSIEDLSLLSLQCSRSEIDRQLASSDRNDRILGIRLLPWLRGEEQYVHDRIMEVLSQESTLENHAEVAAALEALQFADGAHNLLRISEVDRVRRFLSAKTQDVRRGAIRSLGIIGASPSVSIQVTSELLVAIDTMKLKSVDYRSAVQAAALTGRDSPAFHDWLFKEVARRVRNATKGDCVQDTVVLLRCCQQTGANAPASLTALLLEAVGNYKLDDSVRKEAMVTIGFTSVPTVVVADFLVSQLKAVQPKFVDSISKAIRRFAERCRRRAEYVQAISSRLEALEAALIARHGKALLESGPGSGLRLSELRRAVEEVQHVLRSYREFAARKKLH